MSRRTGGFNKRKIPTMKAKTHDGHPPKPAGEKYLTRKEVAARFGVDVRTIDNWRDKYKMPHYCVGGQVRFVGSEVDEWMKTRRRGGPVPGKAEGRW
jgi:excisionase family DNA binding protein